MNAKELIEKLGGLNRAKKIVTDAPNGAVKFTPWCDFGVYLNAEGKELKYDHWVEARFSIRNGYAEMYNLTDVQQAILEA